VATVGFPDIGLQGFAPKVLAHGHHASAALAASPDASGENVNYAVKSWQGGVDVGLLSSSQINHFQSAASLMNCNL
jgi:hypothetical protein